VSGEIDTLPRLAIFHSETSAPIFELVEAAQGLCRIVWIVGWAQDGPPSRVLARFGEVVDLAGLNLRESIERVVAVHPDGVAVFNDPPLVFAAQVARQLELPFHSPETAHLLTDKFSQRQALERAGLPVPRYAAIDSSSAHSSIAFPAVLKPRTGAGSRDVFRVENSTDVTDALEKCAPGEAFILEEWLADRGSKPSLAADVVSVESVVHEEEMEHVMVTGRFPFAPPLREVGSFMPSDLNSADWHAATSLAGDAARALGITFGIVHTEIKMTPVGPRLVEVNGRLGGEISGLITRLGGPSMIAWSMRASLGLQLDGFPDLLQGRVAFFRLVVAPPNAPVFRSVRGVAELKIEPGVSDVVVKLKPNDVVEVQKGYGGYALKIDGVAESLEELAKLQDRIERTLTVTWDKV